MKRYPFGSDSFKLPSIFKLSFKAGAGAYLGWQTARFVDLLVTNTLHTVVGTSDEIAAKISKVVFGKKD